MRNKEVKLEFTNWELDEIIVEVARHIREGYHVATWKTEFSYYESIVEVTMVYRNHY